MKQRKRFLNRWGKERKDVDAFTKMASASNLNMSKM